MSHKNNIIDENLTYVIINDGILGAKCKHWYIDFYGYINQN